MCVVFVLIMMMVLFVGCGQKGLFYMVDDCFEVVQLLGGDCLDGDIDNEDIVKDDDQE